jgi:ABC-type transporter Mla subunit MlaD
LADETKTENNTPTAEDYAALKTELEAERKKTATQVAEATKGLQAKVTSLEAEVATRTKDIEALKGQLVEASTNFEGAKAAYAYAVEDFKKLAASSNPLIPQEAIYGASIEEIKASLNRANKLVANVQESLSRQAAAASVPAGAPQRTGPDASTMSTKEKINLGLEQARKKKEQ